MQGHPLAAGELQAPAYMPLADPGNQVGGTATGVDSFPVSDWENIFGPAGRDVVADNQRQRRYQRWHLPDRLKGSNEFLATRVDGLIVDATQSPWTTVLLPYREVESPDAAINWSVYSYDAGLASRVPYEAAGRVLTQSRTTHSAFAVRQGLAIKVEHNFFASPEGRLDFNRQLLQLIGSVQQTNDLDVILALTTCPSYERVEVEKYGLANTDAFQLCRRYADIFGFMQKNNNALDILIEEARETFRRWGAPEPNLLICNSKIGFQNNMLPEKTQYLTQGPDGQRKLRDGPELRSYRGLNVINSRSYSLETGRPPRDVLNRRVRVAEYYVVEIPTADLEKTFIELYDENRDSFVRFSGVDLLRQATSDTVTTSKIYNLAGAQAIINPGTSGTSGGATTSGTSGGGTTSGTSGGGTTTTTTPASYSFLILRPCIEHSMLGMMVCKGGEDLGATFWGQSELACSDDTRYGTWLMQYKYHSRAICYGDKQMVRVWDVAFSDYHGGGSTEFVDWDETKMSEWARNVTNMEDPLPFDFKSLIVMGFVTETDLPLKNLSNPIAMPTGNIKPVPADPENLYHTFSDKMSAWINKVKGSTINGGIMDAYISRMPDWTTMHKSRSMAGQAAAAGDTHTYSLAFEGTHRIIRPNGAGATTVEHKKGTGHLGEAYVGCASVRAGRGHQYVPQNGIQFVHAM